jgi:hypothetical protein
MTLSIAEAEAALSGAGALPVRKSTVHKSRAAIKQAVELPWCGLAGRYPGLSLETIEGPGDGYNAWLRVYLPKNLTSQRQDVQHTAFVLADEFDNKTSIAVLPIVQEKEPVHG